MGTRRLTVGAVATATALALVAVAPTGPSSAAPAAATDYTVVAEDGVSADAAVAAITAAGGRVVARNDGIGVFQVTSTRTDFASRAAAAEALIGAAQNRAIGYAPVREKTDAVEKENRTVAGATGTSRRGGGSADMDPLDEKLWGLEMVRSDESRRKQPGSKGVTVGILDTGLDASNPDLAANFSTGLSRNFAPDKIDIDGPCEVASCLDPVGTDDGGHGTHVAGTVGAAANGVGLSGVAPNVTLVELKGGQDSGFFFLEPVVNALTYAGDAGLDVVNMSFFVDPWLYNCLDNPLDSAEAKAEQRAIIRAMTRALTYAHLRGVTLVSALGNQHTDLGDPLNDAISPNYGPVPPYEREIDNNTCWTLPTEGPFVIGVSSVGPSTKKSDFSNYGTEQISVSAPGGWFRDGIGTPSFMTDANMILSSYPKKVLQEEGLVDADGNITPDGEGVAFKDCTADGRCGYYTYLQGTSMASPHAAGVAALIVSQFGKRDRRGGVSLEPWKVENQLLRTAAEHACPEPRLQTYTAEGRPAEFNAFCDGGENFNGFYGYGIVDAYAAVTTTPRWGARP